MAKALDLINTLKASSVTSHDIDWEAVLRLNYCVLLDAGGRFIDIGGNEGAHSHCFIEDMKASELAIFEPIPNMLERLHGRFDGNDRVKIYALALGDKNGDATFQLKTGAVAESGLARKGIYSNGTVDDIIELNVEVRRLDDVDVGFSPDFIKVDIEGGEIDMLKGSKQTIGKSRPLISVEYGFIGYEAFGHERGSLPSWAQDNRYLIYDLFGNRIDFDEFMLCADQFYWDYLLIPAERVDGLSVRLEIIERLTRSLPISKHRKTSLDIINRY